MSVRLALAAALAVIAAACRPEWPKEEPVGGKAATLFPCDVGPSGRFVISADSVGPFDVATATMDDVVSSCGSVSTEYESTCCYMAVIARFDYPGVHVAAEQESDDSVARPLSRVRRWEVTGDSIHVKGLGPMPATVAGLARLGPGWAEHPTHDDNDGPQARLCALPNIRFRIRAPDSLAGKTWPVDSGPANRAIAVVGAVVQKAAGSPCKASPPSPP